MNKNVFFDLCRKVQTIHSLGNHNVSVFIFQEYSEHTKHSERYQKILPIPIWMGGHKSVCLSVCLNLRERLITFDGLKGLW